MSISNEGQIYESIQLKNLHEIYVSQYAQLLMLVFWSTEKN